MVTLETLLYAFQKNELINPEGIPNGLQPLSPYKCHNEQFPYIYMRGGLLVDMWL